MVEAQRYWDFQQTRLIRIMDKTKAYGRLFVVAVIWGCNYVVTAYLLREFSPLALSFVRYVLITVFLALVGYMSKEKVNRPTSREWRLIVLSALIGTSLNQIFYFSGFMYSTAGNAALILALTPAVTMLLARFYLGESLNASKLSGAGLALAGVVMIVLFSSREIGISLGDTLLLISMLCGAVNMLMIRTLSRTMTPVNITIYTAFFGTAFLFPAPAAEAALGHLTLSGHAGMWIALILIAIIGQGFTALWWNRGISEVGASVSAMFMNIPPFVAVIAGHFVLGDPINPSQIFGGLLILSGVLLSNWSALKRSAPDVSLDR